MITEKTEVQWRVTWFPPDRAQRQFTGTERAVRKRAEEEDYWNPIIERREVIVSEWEMVP